MTAPTAQELAELRTEVRAWLAEHRPPEPDFLLPWSFMEVGTDQQFDYLRSWQRKVYDAGWLGMAWPAEYGGGGQDQALQTVVNQEMVRAQVPFMVNTIGLNWAGPLILHQGTEEQKQRYIKGILSAEDIWCQGFSEPDNGSDLANAQLRAERDGNEWVLTGSKIWTSLGSYAKYMILLGRTDAEAGKRNKYEGLSFFLAPMQVPGIEPRPIRKMTGEYGFTQTFFNEARIPADSLFGDEGKGWMVAVQTLQFERGAAGGQAGGHSAMRTDVMEVVDLARRVRRDGAPAIEDATVRDDLVQLVMAQEGLRLNGARMKCEALRGPRPASVPMSSKLLGSEFSKRLNAFGTTLTGANGAFYVGDEHAVDGGRWPRFAMNAYSGTIGGGTSEIQHNILAERVLGLPKD